MRTWSRGRRALALGGVLLMGWAPPLTGQGIRGSFQTTARYLELRPLRLDTVSLSRVDTAGGRGTFEGFPVSCVGQACSFYRPRDVENAVAVTQDLSFTAWGLGVQGLSATVQLRSRADAGGALALPRTDDRFDAVLAYLELNRDAYRLRLGRQRILSGLGSTGYDGLDALWEPRRGVRLNAFGGRGLARGLSEPRSDALKGFDEFGFLADDNTLLLGGEVGFRLAAGSDVALRYQREIWADRSGLLSERAALSGRTALLRPLQLDAQADYDFGFGEVGKAHLRAQLPLPRQRLVLEAIARRYTPYFEMWTIWGFFSPVGYNEAEFRTSWAASPRAMLWGSAGYRSYEESHAPVIGNPLEDDAWRLGLGGQLQLTDALGLHGSFYREGPVGGYLSSADAELSWRPGERWGVAVHGSAFQQIEEFRAGESAVFGGGGSFDTRLLPGTRLSAGLDLYRQAVENRPGAADWNQTRGWMMLQVDFGRDPGMARRGAR